MSRATASVGAGVVEAVTISSDQLAPTLHLLASEFAGARKIPRTLEAQMAFAKRASLAGDGPACLKALDRVRSKSVQAWVLALELDCATLTEKPTAATLARLHKVIAKVEKDSALLLQAPSAERLRRAYLEALAATLDQDVKSNRARAAKTIEKLQEMTARSEDALRAKMWRAAGEVAYAQHDLRGAAELMRRGLSEHESAETRTRLQTIENLIKEPPVPAKASQVSAVTPNPDLEASQEELELVARATTALKAGDLVSAVDDAVKLIRGYPGGSRAKWATDRILESYWSIAEKGDAKLASSRAQIIRKMQDVDGERMADWARSLYSRGQWEDAMTLAMRAVDKIEGARATAVLDLAAKSALACDQFENARRLLNRLILGHAGTHAAREALFRSGLLHFRQSEYALALGEFERLLVLPQLNSMELPVRYWLWRSLQKLQGEKKSGPEADRAALAVADLLGKYPFSYYGLRARMDSGDGALEWKSSAEKFTAKLWLTKVEKRAWERLQILMKAGWLEEAQAELRLLPAMRKSEDKAVSALLAAAAGAYVSAARLANDAWDENPELRRAPLVNAAFPKAFAAVIDAEADSRKLDRDLLRGLVKQESGFNPRAVSTSNAYGLTQVIGPTAREIAQDLKLPTPVLPDDLFQPEKSVRFGAYYFSKLLSKYEGSVPLALAGYNAGPTRIDRWLRARPSLKNLAASRSSSPENELWLDEIPYGETSIYVKAILRNLLIYKMLDNGRVQVPEPVWAFGSEGR